MNNNKTNSSYIVVRKAMLVLIVFCYANFSKVQAQINEINVQRIDNSLFWKKNNGYVEHVESETGDLYKKLGHHGPAVENLWVGYRIYFNKTMSVDLLSKFEPRLELKTSQWYGNDSLFNLNYGKDNFKVWKTVGLGGLRLWDNDSAMFFDTQTKRTGAVSKTDTSATITISSWGVLYNNQLIDVEVKLSVFANKRHALVETKVLSGEKVCFATGLVRHSGLKIEKSINNMVSWGDYDSPAAAEVFNVGAALIYNENDFEKTVEQEKQILIVSKPVVYLKYYISSANEKEKEGINTIDKFIEYTKNISEQLLITK